MPVDAGSPDVQPVEEGPGQRVPEPDEASCRRHHAAHLAQYAVGERVQARHILFAVTPGVDVTLLRGRAEQVLLDVRADPRRFAEAAKIAVEEASKTVRHMSWFEVVEQRGAIKDGKVSEFQVTVRIGFKLES